jgi:serine/threonine protein kinase
LALIRQNSSQFEDIQFFNGGANVGYQNIIERCIIIECPLLTLRNIVSSMTKQNYRTDDDRLDSYMSKIQKVFRKIGHSISALHKHNIVHGSLQLDSFGKFEQGWKLKGLIGSQRKGNPMQTVHMDESVPPEAVTYTGNHGEIPQLLETCPATPEIDIWAFGKLLYEVFVGKPLIPREAGKSMKEDQTYLHTLGEWNETNLMEIVATIEETGNGTLAADLISHCLCKRPERRPQSMEDVLSHPFWSASPAQRRSIVHSTTKYGSSSKRRFYT